MVVSSRYGSRHVHSVQGECLSELMSRPGALSEEADRRVKYIEDLPDDCVRTLRLYGGASIASGVVLARFHRWGCRALQHRSANNLLTTQSSGDSCHLPAMLRPCGQSRVIGGSPKDARLRARVGSSPAAVYRPIDGTSILAEESLGLTTASPVERKLTKSCNPPLPRSRR